MAHQLKNRWSTSFIFDYSRILQCKLIHEFYVWRSSLKNLHLLHYYLCISFDDYIDSFFLLGIFLEWNSGAIKYVCVQLWQILPNSFPKQFYQCVKQYMRVPVPHPQWHLVTCACASHLSYSDGCIMYCTVNFIFIFVMVNDLENFFLSSLFHKNCLLIWEDSNLLLPFFWLLAIDL